MPKLNNLIQGVAQKGMQFGKFLQGNAKQQIRKVLPRTQMQPRNYFTPAPQLGPTTPSKLPMPKLIKR
jgi:hypothetical protein